MTAQDLRQDDATHASRPLHSAYVLTVTHTMTVTHVTRFAGESDQEEHANLCMARRCNQ